MSNAPNTVAYQNGHKRGSSRNTDTLICVTMRGFSHRFVCYACMLCTLCVCIVHYSWEGAFVLFPCDMRVIDYRCGIVANGIYAFAR